MENKSDIRWYETVDSTNDEARRQITALDNLSVIAAGCQTEGRGQGDHKWHSRPGENLTFSIVLKFGGEDGLAPLLARDSLLITQLVTHAIRRYLSGKGIESYVKWPNDIYCGSLKICGILIENVFKGRYVRSSIVGIGLNLNQTEFPDDLPNPVSVSKITGLAYSPEDELVELHKCLCESAEMTNTAEGRRYLDIDFNENMVRLS